MSMCVCVRMRVRVRVCVWTGANVYMHKMYLNTVFQDHFFYEKYQPELQLTKKAVEKHLSRGV